MMPAINPMIVALAISVAANAALGWAYLGQRDDTTQARGELRAMEGQRDGARQLASECSDATEALREQASRRAAAAAPARAAAASTASALQQRSDYTLSLKPRDPANLCGSMQALGDEWLQGRVKP